MHAIQSSVDFHIHQRDVAAALQDAATLVFIDTNIIAWLFRLNVSAYEEFSTWLKQLADEKRLAIPAWTVHEYNHHLSQGDAAFFLPHKGIVRQLQSNLSELGKSANLVLSEEYATELGHGSREECLQKLSEATEIINKFASHLARSDASRRHDRVLLIERLIESAGLKSSIHRLTELAVSQARERYAARLAPGYKDGSKEANAYGDLIIWNELIETCASRSTKSAILLTNDQKADWVYTPSTVILANGKPVNRGHPFAQQLKLPKPELVAEFEHHTGGRQLNILSIEFVIDILSSVQINSHRAQRFRHLAHAVKSDTAQDPTELALQWFLDNPEAVSSAISGVCYWHYSPSDVDQEEFVAWATARMKLKDSDAKKINWGVVFCEFFI